MDWGKIYQNLAVLAWAGGDGPGASADLSIFPVSRPTG